MSFNKRLRRFARKNRGVVSGDPNGVLATLQIAKRLFGENDQLTLNEALVKALPMAGVKDSARALFAATRVVLRHTPSEWPTNRGQLLDVLSESIKDQGRVNLLAAKGPR